jgi:hypothetical protein
MVTNMIDVKLYHLQHYGETLWISLDNSLNAIQIHVA